jgi:hypothetical protein
VDALLSIDLARMTPLAALNALAALQEQAMAATAPPPLRLVGEPREGEDGYAAPGSAAPP